MKKDLINIEQIFIEFSTSKTLKEINEKLTLKLSEILPIVECSLFSLEENSVINFSETTWLSEIFKKNIEYFEEQGIIKWVILSKEMKCINSTQTNDSNLNYYVLPIYLYGYPMMIFVFSSNIDEKETSVIKNDLIKLTTTAGIIWNNLKDREEIQFLKNKFEDLENQIFNHSLLESLSQEILTISEEISTSLKLIETNFHLVLSGIGDSAKRVDIINSNFEYLTKINDKVKHLLSKNIDNNIGNINLKLVIDDIIEFTSLKLRKENIEIIFRFDEDLSKPIIYASYSEIEKALFNIIIFCSNLINDGGKVEIYLSETPKRFNLTITDNSRGIDNSQLANLLEPISKAGYKNNINLYFAKKAIIKNNGTLSFHSVVDKGNTFKISFPKVIVEDK